VQVNLKHTQAVVDQAGDGVLVLRQAAANLALQTGFSGAQGINHDHADGDHAQQAKQQRGSRGELKLPARGFGLLIRTATHGPSRLRVITGLIEALDTFCCAATTACERRRVRPCASGISRNNSALDTKRPTLVRNRVTARAADALVRVHTRNGDHKCNIYAVCTRLTAGQSHQSVAGIPAPVG
jgi:hypothetical protein